MCKKHRYREHRAPCIKSVFWCTVCVGEKEEMHLKQLQGPEPSEFSQEAMGRCRGSLRGQMF